MNILVTGGAGYIGSHTCKELSLQGHKPVTLDNLERGRKELVQWGPLYVGNISDSKLVLEILKTENIDAIIHFAAYCYVGESVENPMLYHENNFINTQKFLKTCISTGKTYPFVFSSTCATYGIPDKVPINEDEALSPINPYGKTKLMVEYLLKDLSDTHQIKCIALRYFNAAGADPELGTGECHDPETHLIPLTLKAAYSDAFTLKVFGNDYPTSDGTCVRDYIHVKDLAIAHIKALELLQKNSTSFDIFNLGTNTGVSNKNIIDCVESITGKKVKYEYVDRRAGDPPELIADSQKANTILGWTPKYSNIDHIITTACGWYKKHNLN